MNQVHPFAYVHPAAKLGTGNTIGPFCVIEADAEIGDNNVFVAHVCIGTPAQHRTAKEQGGVKIGDSNTFHEYSQVQRSTNPERPTIVKDDCYLMKGAHVAHDCIVESGVTMCNDVALGGHVHVMRCATLGFGVLVHQYQVIGSYSMLGAGAVVPKKIDILPGEMYAGNPAKHLGRNEIGLERNGITALVLKDEHARYNLLRRGW